MIPRWTMFSGIRTAQGKHQATVRNGPYVSVGDFADTAEEAVKSASNKFETEFAPFLTSDTDLSALLSYD